MQIFSATAFSKKTHNEGLPRSKQFKKRQTFLQKVMVIGRR